MAVIKDPILFFVTSPRSPFKMRPEIKLLVSKFKGQKWTANRSLQTAFMKLLATQPDFHGSDSQNDPAFSARDRISRGPKALGFASLDPIALTSPGQNFLDDDLSEEAFLRQLLKFQVPSPFHVISKQSTAKFCIRPYLEILRLIHTLGRLTFDELCLFGMQLTDWHSFDAIVQKVRDFRIAKEKHKGQYKKFLFGERQRVVKEIFTDEIAKGKIKTRESKTANLDKFVKTKAGNMRDYADACLRYLRATGLVTISNPGRTLSIIESRREDVNFILNTVERDPVFVRDEAAYCAHLYAADEPKLLTDDRTVLLERAISLGLGPMATVRTLATSDLKKRIRQTQNVQRQAVVDAYVTELKSFEKYDDVISVFSDIRKKDVFDPSLAMEWNSWRLMTMMDGGHITANLSFDDAGNPLSTAPGNNADIVCDYGDFFVTVEVTLLSGSKQYDAEGEPVARHLGDVKAKTGKPAFCLFVAPTINESSIAYFYSLHQTNIKKYGGKSVIVPIALSRFTNMLTQARESGSIPQPEKIRAIGEYSRTAAAEATDETTWYKAISRHLDHWLG